MAAPEAPATSTTPRQAGLAGTLSPLVPLRQPTEPHPCPGYAPQPSSHRLLPLPTIGMCLAGSSPDCQERSCVSLAYDSRGQPVRRQPQTDQSSAAGPPLGGARPWEGPLLSTQLRPLPHQPASSCTEQPHPSSCHPGRQKWGQSQGENKEEGGNEELP